MSVSEQESVSEPGQELVLEPEGESAWVLERELALERALELASESELAPEPELASEWTAERAERAAECGERAPVPVSQGQATVWNGRANRASSRRQLPRFRKRPISAKPRP